MFAKYLRMNVKYILFTQFINYITIITKLGYFIDNENYKKQFRYVKNTFTNFQRKSYEGILLVNFLIPGERLLRINVFRIK